MNINLSNPAFLLFVLQRMSGAILALLLFVHIIVIIYAVPGWIDGRRNYQPRARQRVLDRVLLGICPDRNHSCRNRTSKDLHRTASCRSSSHRFGGLASYIAGALWLGFHAIEAIW